MCLVTRKLDSVPSECQIVITKQFGDWTGSTKAELYLDLDYLIRKYVSNKWAQSQENLIWLHMNAISINLNTDQGLTKYGVWAWSKLFNNSGSVTALRLWKKIIWKLSPSRDKLRFCCMRTKRSRSACTSVQSWLAPSDQWPIYITDLV